MQFRPNIRDPDTGAMNFIVLRGLPAHPSYVLSLLGTCPVVEKNILKQKMHIRCMTTRTFDSVTIH